MGFSIVLREYVFKDFTAKVDLVLENPASWL